MRRFAKLLKPIITSALVVCLIGNLAVTANAASPKIQANVSTRPVTTNLSSGSLPNAVNSMEAGKSYYFNISSTTDNKIKKYILHMKAPGDKGYHIEGSETARTFMRYAYIPVKLYKTGTYYFYWSAEHMSGETESFRVRNINVVGGSNSSGSNANNSTASKINNFLNDARFRNGITWNSSQRPKLSKYSCTGCFAYTADLVKSVFGVDNPRSGKRFTSTSSISSNCVLHLSPTHWIYVISKNGNSLYTAEGNASGKVCIKNGKYYISGSKIKTNYSTFSLVEGFRF